MLACGGCLQFPIPVSTLHTIGNLADKLVIRANRVLRFFLFFGSFDDDESIEFRVIEVNTYDAQTNINHTPTHTRAHDLTQRKKADD